MIDLLVWLFQAWLLCFVFALIFMMLRKVYQDCCAAFRSIIDNFRHHP
jgi:hypothetical protein